MKGITQETINQLVNSGRPERLSLEIKPPITDDHAAHIFQLTQLGQTALAADHLLFPEMSEMLSETVSGVIRQLNILFYTARPLASETKESFHQKVSLRRYAYETLLEMALNFHGIESCWLNEEEKEKSLQFIRNVLTEWEELERKEGEVSIAKAVVRKWLSRMKRVQKGNSMVAQTALRIESALDDKKHILLAFLRKAEEEIKTSIYYRMVKEGKCKFGNDYALGLRWLRHLGFEQVSTNPVLAARAYQDEPELISIFREEARHHPNFKQWCGRPQKKAEEITLFATLLALWDNLYVFRPIFFNLRETSGGGVVSFQLNPNIAHLVDESIRDVFQAFSLASENLAIYDRYLLAGYPIDGERGRPNMVIKVAATSPAARIITRRINAFGFGSNITVDFSLSQEATLLLEEMEGMAVAVKKGIRPTQLYMTNMGGRLESHLREAKLEEFFGNLREELGEQRALMRIEGLSEANGTKDKISKARGYEEKVVAATRYAHGQKTLNEAIFKAFGNVVSKESLQEWEDTIGKSGTFVARRLWGIFFSDRNREQWIAYLMKKHDLTREQASLIVNRIHYLPASKRKPFDTYWTLSSRNLVHTEFPDHQENMRKTAQDPQFNLEEFEDSISHTFPIEILERLNKMEDFRKAYEINSELAEIFKEAGISEDFGLAGLTPEDWSQFGPVQKTLSEFKSAYDSFQKEMVSALREFIRRKQNPKKKGQKTESKKRR
jgi:hypothetical protein